MKMDCASCWPCHGTWTQATPAIYWWVVVLHKVWVTHEVSSDRCWSTSVQRWTAPKSVQSPNPSSYPGTCKSLTGTHTFFVMCTHTDGDVMFDRNVEATKQSTAVKQANPVLSYTRQASLKKSCTQSALIESNYVLRCTRATILHSTKGSCESRTHTTTYLNC